MASSTAFGDLDSRRRDACPSAHRPFQAADGALLRVRVPGGTITSAGLRALASAASLSDNGVVELTNRANVQLRGFSSKCASAALTVLEQGGLVLSDGEADARRNVISSPLSGLDPAALLDVAGAVAGVTEVLRAWTGPISPKFGVIVDCGGAAHLRGRRHDVVLGAVRHEGRVVFEVALGSGLPLGGGAHMDDEVLALVVDPASAAHVVRAALRLCEAGERPGDVVTRLGRAGALHALGAATAGWIVDASTLTRPNEPSRAPIGIGTNWVGAAPVLGRIDGATLRALGELTDRFGCGEARITPWRGVVVPLRVDDLRVAADAGALASGLEGIALCTDETSTALDVIACAGSTGCTSGEADAQADARTLIARRPTRSRGPVHFSGCAKRCASRSLTGVTLIADGGHYDMFDGMQLVAERLTPNEAIACAYAETI